MTNNILMKVVNDNNEERILSGSIIVELLKNYTSDWGKISSSSVIEDTTQTIESDDPNIELFNKKIGYVTPKFSLSQIVEEVVEAIREENPDYVMDYHSFNDIEKIAIYFILRVNNNRNIKEVFDTLNNNYDDISKRDLLIKYLTEVPSPETDNLKVNPIYTLYNIFNFMKTHEPREYNFDSNKNFKGKLEFKEDSFPMHSYNVTTRYAPLAHQNKTGYSGDVRNYRDTFNASFRNNNTANLQENIIRNKSLTGEAVLQNKIIDEKYPEIVELINNSVLPDDAPEEAKYILESIKKLKLSYRTLLMIANNDDNYMNKDDENLVKYLSENFFDYSPRNDKRLSLSPFTMAYPGASAPSNYKFGDTTHSSNFNRFKTIMSYYVSDINFWLTADKDSTNSDYDNYVYTNSKTDILPSNSKVETKGYFNNLMFLESSIKRILYPKVLEFSKGLYNGEAFKTNNGYDYNKIFPISNEQETYDQIFDSIVNNAYIFTDRNATGTNLDKIKPNYEYLTGRLLLNNPNNKLISKPNTINEFILNYIINSGSDVQNGNRYFSTNEKFSETNKFPTAADYNVLDTNITTEFNSGNNIHYYYLKMESPTYSTNLKNTLEYKFDELFEPDKNLIKDVVASYIGNASGINKNIRYKDTKFFKLPVHSAENINRSIVRTTREMLLDISDITNFDIEGMSTADLTYGEKALLEEYISEYRSFNNLRDETNVQVIEQMHRELNQLKSDIRDKTKSYYFPDWIRDQSGAITAIQDLLKRSIYKVTRFNKSRVTPIHKQIKELYKHRAVDVEYITQNKPTNNERISGKTLDKEFLKNIRIIINEIALTDEFKLKLEEFNTGYQTGTWTNVVNILGDLRDILIDDNNIEPIMSNMYKGTDKSLLKKLDTSIYKLIIKNFFSYLTDTELTSNLNDTNALIKMLLTDNDNNGILKYYSDLIELMKFLETYIELLPKYVDYINNNIIDRYYDIIKAVHKLPSWDYESFHIRDREKDLKLSSGINKHDYNIVWDYSPTTATRSKNMRIAYTKKNTTNYYGYQNISGMGIRTSSELEQFYQMMQKKLGSDDYRISEPIYKGGFTNKDVDEKEWFEQRDKWWRRWIKSDGNTDGFSNKRLFKVPNVEFVDMNVNIDTDDWDWDLPLIGDDIASSNRFKRDLFAKMNHVKVGKYDNSALPYAGDGKIANLSSFKYITSNANGNYYENIGVPLLLLDQEAHKEYNLSNTIRDKSFSFEHIFLNMWFTDENYNGKTKETRALTFKTQKLISLAQEYKHFGIGNIDLQKLFRHYWNWESTPMTNTSTVMNHEIFPTWNSGYDYSKGHFPWSTSTSKEMNAWLFWLTNPLIAWLLANDVPVSNKYLMGYVLEPRYGNNHNVSWMPVRLNGDMEEPHYVFFWDNFQENRDGVAGTITHEQISSNFYWKIKGESFPWSKMKDAALDIWNRNLRNRIYISLFNWRHINGNILTKVDNYTPIVTTPSSSTGTRSSGGGGLPNSNISKQINKIESVVM